jgi:hypothetical protein
VTELVYARVGARLDLTAESVRLLIFGPPRRSRA